MRTPTSLDAQLADVQGDPVRVLVAGAGVAGLTLAQALRTDGLHPVLVERAAPDADRGYMLALMPLVEPVIAHIGATEAYRAHSQPLHRYRLHGRHGDVIQEYSMDALLAGNGDYRGIARGELLRVLSTGGTPATFGTTIGALAQSPHAVRATLTDGTAEVEAEFDAVIAADGLHSATRGLVLRPDQVEVVDTGWGGWVAWSASEPATADLGEETWGARFFIGIYPVQGRDGVIVAGAHADTAAGPARFIAQVREELRQVDPRTDRALAAIAGGRDLYYWKLTDCRSATWSVGRVGLVGDAAAGFLPTAGIAAVMAMESAGQLAWRLSRAARGNVPDALRDFERVQRPRVEVAQSNSRLLARLMFRRSEVVAAMRDVAVRFIPLEVALGPIRRLFDEAPAA